MFIRLSFMTLVFALAALGKPVRRNATQVESDIQKLEADVQALDASVKTLPDSGSANLSQVLAIHNAATMLESTFDAATKHVTDSEPFTETDASNILGLVAYNVPLIQTALGDFKAKKLVVSATGTDTIAVSDLMNLKARMDAFGNALLGKTPADKKSEGQKQLDMVNASFDSAIATFSS